MEEEWTQAWEKLNLYWFLDLPPFNIQNLRDWDFTRTVAIDLEAIKQIGSSTRSSSPKELQPARRAIVAHKSSR